jgi:putative acetyltransferase
MTPGTPTLPIKVRPERAGDALPVRAHLTGVFGRTAEADLVDVLRLNSEIVLALVAERTPATVVGYAAFSRLFVETPSTRSPAVGLAQLAVAANLQRRGLGSALVRNGLGALAERGEQLVFVLGNPGYYARFGFDVAAAAPYVSRYAGAHFMVRQMREAAPTNGTLRYPSAFVDLD